jgi:hypothetical protein
MWDPVYRTPRPVKEYLHLLKSLEPYPEELALTCPEPVQSQHPHSYHLLVGQNRQTVLMACSLGCSLKLKMEERLMVNCFGTTRSQAPDDNNPALP